MNIIIIYYYCYYADLCLTTKELFHPAHYKYYNSVFTETFTHRKANIWCPLARPQFKSFETSLAWENS